MDIMQPLDLELQKVTYQKVTYKKSNKNINYFKYNKKIHGVHGF